MFLKDGGGPPTRGNARTVQKFFVRKHCNKYTPFKKWSIAVRNCFSYSQRTQHSIVYTTTFYTNWYKNKSCRLQSRVILMKLLLREWKIMQLRAGAVLFEKRISSFRLPVSLQIFDFFFIYTAQKFRQYPQE
jgi:hypothetical protein